MKTLLAMALLLAVTGTAHAACTLPAGPLVPYDYFNDTALPKIELSGITCEEAQADQAYYQTAVGDPGTVNRTSNPWAWQGFQCGNGGEISGSGESLAWAAKTLTIWGCASGVLTNQTNGHSIPY